MGVSRPKPSRPSANFRSLGRDSGTVWDGLGQMSQTVPNCPKQMSQTVPNRPEHDKLFILGWFEKFGMVWDRCFLNVWEQIDWPP